ncbi:hypothetical protein HUT18_08400 [Streptomyces sp. NA04227]|uniref:hypothetical protein n=1 Tax=Streptomyces sp. NA04227 TaxID=2742136 RepID=UPI001592775B|nr:hypothetical protein HUT18_08400 [Streptomyces sp. NA04227]
MSKRQISKMFELMASGEIVELTSRMASVKKLARLAFLAEQFGYQYADVRQAGSQNSALKMLIVPDLTPQARERAGRSWAQYPQAAAGGELPPFEPAALELLKARINFDLTGKSAEKRMVMGGVGVTLGCGIAAVQAGSDLAPYSAGLWALLMAILGVGFFVTRKRNAKFAARLQQAGYTAVTDESGRTRYLPPGGQLPGHGNPFGPGMGEPDGNPFAAAAPQQATGNPFAGGGQASGNPFAAQAQQQYGHGGHTPPPGTGPYAQQAPAPGAAQPGAPAQPYAQPAAPGVSQGQGIPPAERTMAFGAVPDPGPTGGPAQPGAAPTGSAPTMAFRAQPQAQPAPQSQPQPLANPQSPAQPQPQPPAQTPSQPQSETPAPPAQTMAFRVQPAPESPETPAQPAPPAQTMAFRAHPAPEAPAQPAPPAQTMAFRAPPAPESPAAPASPGETMMLNISGGLGPQPGTNPPHAEHPHAEPPQEGQQPYPESRQESQPQSQPLPPQHPEPPRP